jgi:hypothetical protein
MYKILSLVIFTTILTSCGSSDQPKTESAVLTWTANTETDLVGYRVYRGENTACANSAPLEPALIELGLVETYTDPLLPVGTWCYELTAFNATVESARSNRASKDVR